MNHPGKSSPQSPAITRGGPPLFATDYGCAADGVTDDADALTDFILQCSTVGRWAGLPAGIYALGHPVTIPWHVKVQGFGGSPLDGNGCILMPTSDFNLKYNPGGAPACVLQSNTYAPDPTGQDRWVYGSGDLWPGACIDGIGIDCSNCPSINGVGIWSFDDHSRFQNFMVRNALSGFYLTGIGTGGKFDQCSTWNCSDGGFRITSHPIFHPEICGGTYYFDGTTGDLNTPAKFIIEGQSTAVFIECDKFEHPTKPSDSVVLFRQNPLWKGTGQRPNGGTRNVLVMKGNYAGSIYQPPFQNQTGTAIVGIDCDLSTDPSEWQRPSINICGIEGFRYLIRDQPAAPNQASPMGNGLLVPIDNFGWTHYTSDPNEITIT